LTTHKHLFLVIWEGAVVVFYDRIRWDIRCTVRELEWEIKGEECRSKRAVGSDIDQLIPVSIWVVLHVLDVVARRGSVVCPVLMRN
jgi:hypothetical protein